MGRRSRKFREKSRRGHSTDVRNSKDSNTRSFNMGPGTSVTAVRYQEQKLVTQTLIWAWLESREIPTMAEHQKSEHSWLLFKNQPQMSARAILSCRREQSDRLQTEELWIQVRFILGKTNLGFLAAASLESSFITTLPFGGCHSCLNLRR